ncbi:MAG: hypothetical protein PF517_09255 [Salinivirgaceae bacterium]|nr:hypothetical protein [Salinivirgaceae bacterium]
MRKIYFFILTILLSSAAFAQDDTAEKKEPIVKLSGHIRYEGYFDTYESVTSRDGNFYLYPVSAVENSNGEDIKAYNQFDMMSAQSRLRAKINGPEAFGAKINGTAEIDFFGKAEGFEQMPRIRHMFMNLSWEKASLTLGQTWHPIFVTECFPQVLSMGAAIPFNPLNRAPQIKYTYKLSNNIQFVAAALSYKDHNSKGPARSQERAVIPDIHFQLKYASENFYTGIVAGYKTFKPRTILADSTITEKKAGSFDAAAYAKIKVSNLTFKVYGIYGENTSPYVMIGGYGAASDPTDPNNPDYDYSNIQTMSFWSELMYKSLKFRTS